MTRILIAVPCFDTVAADFAFSLARIIGHGGINATVVDCRGSNVVGARNSAAQQAIDGGYSHLAFLDSDMNLPADTLTRLLAWGKPVVGATYVRRCEPWDLLGCMAEPWGDKLLVEAEEMPTGCLLISTVVLRKIGWPWFRFEYGDEPGEFTGEDIYFSRRCAAVGLKLYCDRALTQEVGHVGVKRWTVKDGIEHIKRTHPLRVVTPGPLREN